MRQERDAGRERGFALLIVLWSVVLLSLLVTHLTASGRGEVQLAGNLRRAAVLEAAAEGAIQEAMFHALDTSARHWPADGAAHRIRLGDAVIDVVIRNEAGKVNLNTARPELLEALLRAIGVDTRAAASLAAAIADWRFPDAQIRAGGAKARQYREAGRDYGPPQAPFQSLDELGLVLGMTPDLLARLTPYLSIYHDGDPDPRLAAPAVLAAIRAATGLPPVIAPGAPAESVVDIAASVAGPDGGRLARHAIVRLGLRPDGGLFQILTWRRGDG